MRVAASIGLLAILFATAIVASSPPQTVFVTLTQSFKIKIPYGETVIPARTKLEVVSTDNPATVQVVYMGQVQTIPRDFVQFEPASRELPGSTPATSPSPPPPRPPPSLQQPIPSFGMGWDSLMQGGDITMRELQSLLSPHCTPAVDLGGYGINIYNGVRYLMDSDEAAGILGVRGHIPSRVRVATPGFPRNTLSYTAYDGNFEGHFNRLYVVTDTANQVVCVQLVDEHPRPGDAQGSWNTYNFINTRLRASPCVHVVDESTPQGDVMQVETRMYEPRKVDRRGRCTDYQEMESTKLLIPIPFARIILHCTQIGLSRR
jgi:hypothetical protein